VAIGIGASTAIFSVVNAILLRPLPFAEPERLMQVAEKNDALKLSSFGVSALNYLDWKARTQAFDQMGAIGFGTYTLTGRGDPETYRQRDQPVRPARARPAARARARVCRWR
jgi:putative ABC transport system permease protein